MSTGKITEPALFRLTIKNTINPNIVGNIYVYSFWVEPGKITLFTGKTGWLVNRTYGLVANPTKINLENSGTQIIENSYNGTDKETLNKWNTNKSANPIDWKRVEDSIKIDFINKHPKNYYSLYMLNNDLRQQNPDYTTIETLLNKLSKEVKNTYLGRETEERIKINKTIRIGMRLPDFEQTDTRSKPVKLSSLRG